MRLCTLPATKYVKPTLAALFGEKLWWPLATNGNDVLGKLVSPGRGGTLSHTTFKGKPCLLLPGDSYLDIPSFTFGTKWSLSLWFSPLDYKNYAHLFSSSPNNANNGMYYKIAGQADPNVPGRSYFYTPENGKSIIADRQVVIGEWNLMTITYDAGVLKLYQGDVQVATFTKTFSIIASIFKIGSNGSNEFSRGYQRDVRFWDKAIDIVTIRQILAQG